ncbi:MAG: glycerophosphodiester phosphodiesterase family protein, partial [Planctomycetota bacterium]
MSFSRFAQKVNKDFLRIAHRGACIFAPENTIESFQLAVDIGVDMIETDVRMTQDEVLVLAHDSGFLHHSEIEERFPGRKSYLLRDFLFSDIRQLTDVGIRYVQEVRQGKSAARDCFHSITLQERQTFLNSSKLSQIQRHIYLIPSLEEAMDWFKQTPNILFNLELKTYPQSHPKIVPAFINALKKYPQERLLISSFDHYALFEI